MPNHVRLWTRDIYWTCGGRNPEVHVCDDGELLLRTFSATRMVHIQRFVELGADDFLRRPGGALDWDAPIPTPTPFANDLFDGERIVQAAWQAGKITSARAAVSVAR